MLSTKAREFKVNIETKCLVLSSHPGDETLGLGGFIAQFPKNFEVLCFTNGSSLIKDKNALDSSRIKRQQFTDAMKTARVKGYKIFDIDDNTLDKNYHTFSKIDISEADYIFVPNVYDRSSDTLSLLRHLQKLLEEKEYKQSLKIIFYECSSALALPDYYVNISSILELKKALLNTYNIQNTTDAILGLNKFRALQVQKDYAESFMSLDVEEFCSIALV